NIIDSKGNNVFYNGIIITDVVTGKVEGCIIKTTGLSTTSSYPIAVRQTGSSDTFVDVLNNTILPYKVNGVSKIRVDVEKTKGQLYGNTIIADEVITTKNYSGLLLNKVLKTSENTSNNSLDGMFYFD